MRRLLVLLLLTVFVVVDAENAHAILWPPDAVGCADCLQGIPICTTPPTLDQVLAFNNGVSWCPASDLTLDSLTVNQIIGQGPTAAAIHGMNWNNVIDLSNPVYGCHNDYTTTQQLGATVTTVDASTTLVASIPAWTSNDCNSGAGCTGPNDKTIRIESTAGGYNTLNTRIVGFTSSTQITMAAPYPSTVAGGANDTAEWGTPDDTCLSNVIASGGDTSQTRALYVHQSIPVIFTNKVLVQNKTGEWDCNGMGQSARDNANQEGGFIYMGDAPDQDGFDVQDSWGFTVKNCWLVGATSAPLKWGFKWINSGTGPHPNAFNTFDHVAAGGFGSLVQGPADNGAGAVVNGSASNIVGGNTSFTVSNPSNALFRLGPGNPIYVRDPVAGNEVVYTSDSYVRGANPVTLNQQFAHAHSAVNVSMLWPIAPIINGIGWDWNGTQDDRNNLYKVSTRNTGVGIMAGEGDVLTHILAPNVNGSLIGILSAGARTQVDEPQWDGTCLTRVVADLAHYVEITALTQPQATQNSCGPNFAVGSTPPVPGLNIEVLFDQAGITFTSGSQGGDVQIIGSSLNFGENVSVDGTVIDLGSGQGVRLDLNGVQMTANSPAGPPIGLSPAIHVFPTGLFQYTIRARTSSATKGYALTVIDPGFADNRFLRDYTLEHIPSSVLDFPTYTHRVLRGAEAWNNTPQFIATEGRSFLRGEVDTSKMDVAQPAFSCSCTTTGTSFYRYKIAYSVNGHPQAISNETTTLSNCASSVSSINTIICSAFPVRRADTLNYYRTTVNGTSNTEQFAGSVPYGFSPSNAHFQISFVDSTPDGSLTCPSPQCQGGAPPVVDQSGETILANSLNMTPSTVGGLPAVCNPGDHRAVSDWNGTNGLCVGSSVNYVWATCGTGNAWFCP